MMVLIAAFYKYKQSVNINKIDIIRIIISDKDSYDNKGSFKCFIGYKSNEGIRQL